MRVECMFVYVCRDGGLLLMGGYCGSRSGRDVPGSRAAG